MIKPFCTILCQSYTLLPFLNDFYTLLYVSVVLHVLTYVCTYYIYVYVCIHIRTYSLNRELYILGLKCMYIRIYAYYIVTVCTLCMFVYGSSLGAGGFDGNQPTDSHPVDGARHTGPLPCDAQRGKPSHQLSSREDHFACILGTSLRLSPQLLLQLHN